jgi:outer membrane protein OmpA-like peptidoglycan-associated protein
MKKLVFLLLGILPIILVAQNKCNFFDNVKIKIDKTDLNTSESDFGPSFVNDELWYSAFDAEEIVKLSNGESKDIFYNLFESKLDADGNITGNAKMELVEISKGYHAGPVSYCAKTKELFVTLSNFENPDIKNKVYQKADIRLKIIVVKNVNGSWNIAGELPFNNPTYSVGHPAISVTGDTLFFASNIPDLGKGATDIYMAVRSNGVWGEMKNLGSTINTEKNEMFPFLFKNNMLIFASNGREDGENDLDIYYSCITDNEFSAPVKLGGFDSDGDDFGLVIHENEEIGYFASNRADGKGSDDIYKVEFEGIYNLELTVLDKETMKEVPNPKVSFDDGVLPVLAALIFKRALKKNSSYVATSQVEGYMNSSKTITTVGKPFGTIKETILVEKVVVGQIFVMENIYYDFDKWDILPESEIELDKLVQVMNDNPSWKVELGSHTDCRGNDAYNEKLSQKRSDSAVEYIVNKGIAKDRIVAKGYGETMLVNECDDGVDCTPEQHRKNRRTEFKILEMDGK